MISFLNVLREKVKQHPQGMIVLGMLIFIACSVAGELAGMDAERSSCQTSGCARSSAIAILFTFFMMPFFTAIFYSITWFALRTGLKWTHVESNRERVFSLALFPFIGTSLLFLFAAHFIFEPGYSTDRRYLFFILVKAFLLPVNFLLLIFFIRRLCEVSWRKAVTASLLPSVFLFVLGGFYYFEAKPYLYYLKQKSTYDLAVYHVGATIMRALPHHWHDCYINHEWWCQ